MPRYRIVADATFDAEGDILSAFRKIGAYYTALGNDCEEDDTFGSPTLFSAGEITIEKVGD